MIEAFLGLPQKFKNLCTIYPPTVNDILREETKGLTNILTVTQEEIEDLFIDKVDSNGNPIVPPSVFEYFIINCAYNENFKNQFSKSFELFLHEPVTIFTDLNTIIIGDLENETLIKSIKDAHNSEIYCVRHFIDTKSNSDLLITSSYDKSLKIWNLQNI